MEVDLPPAAFLELAALKSLQERFYCKACRNELLTAQLMKTCDKCGRKVEDPYIAQQLKG